MDSTKRIFRFQKYGLKKSIIGFWSVVLIINILAYILIRYFNSNIGIGLFSNKGDVFSVVGGNIMPIFIFFIVYGIVMYHEDFALALSFGVTRKDYYKSVIIDNMLAVSSFAVIQTVLLIIDKYIIKLLGYNPMVEFVSFNTSTDSILFIVFTLALLFLTFASLTNLLGVLQYRFGYKFWIGFGITFFIAANFFSKLTEMFSGIYLWLRTTFDSSAILILELFIIIICYTLGYFLIKKANVKK